MGREIVRLHGWRESTATISRKKRGVGVLIWPAMVPPRICRMPDHSPPGAPTSIGGQEPAAPAASYSVIEITISRTRSHTRDHARRAKLSQTVMNDFGVLNNRKRALIALIHSFVFLGIAMHGFVSPKAGILQRGVDWRLHPDRNLPDRGVDPCLAGQPCSLHQGADLFRTVRQQRDVRTAAHHLRGCLSARCAVYARDHAYFRSGCWNLDSSLFLTTCG